MGLLNKLLQINKTNHKHQRTSAHDIQVQEDQIRILLFRECDYKGRKVIFDSHKTNGNATTRDADGNHIDLHPPHNQLAEMVFGSVAMGFHSCCFKIHLLQPTLLMFAQLFPSPRHREKVRESFSSSSSQCLEQSTIFEDSATSSTNSSASDQLSTYSTASDQILGDSLSSLSSGNVYKKWLRSNNHNSGSSFGSVKEGASTSSHHRSSKLGFVLIVEAPEDCNTTLVNFCMEHISLLETLMHRCRRLIEIAYAKPHTFEMSMEEVASLSKQGVLNLVRSPNLASPNCDKNVAFSTVNRVSLPTRTSFFTRIFEDVVGHKNVNKVFVSDECDNIKRLNCGSFVDEFCKLLEMTDNKDTSFFISSLITAVLTHHLGWVKNPDANKPTNNPLWNQLLNLYGAIGHPNKMSQTIVTGSSEDVMLKVLNCLAYFIRCCDIEKYELERTNIEEDNDLARNIYDDLHNKQKLDNINNNHLSVKTIGLSKNKTTNLQNTFQDTIKVTEHNNLQPPKGLTKNKSITKNLFEEVDNVNNNPCITIKNNEIVSTEDDVLFVLGENESLVLGKLGDINDNKLHSNYNNNSHSLENITNATMVRKKLVKANSDMSLHPPITIPETNATCQSLMNLHQLGSDKKSNNNMNIIWMPMPRTKKKSKERRISPNTLSVFKGISQNYMPDMVLQGTLRPKVEWIYKLKNDLALTSLQTQFSKFIEEVVAILANTNTWEVHLMSSHTYVIDPNATGIRVYMSQLVANMLESLYVMWKLKVPIKYCIQHLENKLQELCVRSKTLAQMLLKTPFCSMEILNKTLHLDVNDVPLLMAIASVHSPEVTRKYGLSFQ